MGGGKLRETHGCVSVRPEGSGQVPNETHGRASVRVSGGGRMGWWYVVMALVLGGLRILVLLLFGLLGGV